MGDFTTFNEHLKNGDFDGVKRSFQPDFLDRPDGCRWRPIHWACNGGHVNIVQFLIDHNCDTECETNGGMRPIHFACLKGNIDILKLLIQNRCELQCKNEDGRTPLDVAKRRKHRACADFLTETVRQAKLAQVFDCIRKNECQTLKGLNCGRILTREEPETGLSFLEVALQSNANEVIKYFLNNRVHNAEIPLLKHYIENCRRPVAVKLIQECLLSRSIRYHHADGFELSCSANIINGHRNIVTCSFLEIAAEYGTSAFITEILRKSIYNKREWTRAKNLAILKGHNKIVDAILSRESLLTSRTKAHFSLFHNAICDNDPEVMRYIFDNGLADLNYNNEVVGTGLALAHMLCHAKCIEILQQFNVDVNSQNKYCQTPLHEAISSGMTAHCSYLISRAQDIDKPGFMGFNGLQCAVIEGSENLCDELVKNGADCIRYVEGFQQSHLKDTVLPISTRENAVTLCMKIHETIYPCFLNVLDLNKVNCSDGNENTLLHMAVKTLQPDLCKTLINCGANVGAINEQGNSPLFELFISDSDPKILNNNIDKIITISNILIDSGADINKTSRSSVTVFESASKCNDERLMIHLLSKHPNLEILAESDFKLAFTNSWFSYSKALIDQMPEDCLKSLISTEIFHVAIPHADSKLLKSMFIKASCDVQQSIIEDLLLHFATNDEYDTFIKLLETKITGPKLFSNGETLFTSLLKDKHAKYCCAIIRYVPNKKCFNLANILNEIPLQVAIERDLYDFICPLIFECDHLNNEDIYGNTPLIQLFHKLSISTDISIDEKLMTAIKTLISRGEDIYEETSTGKKAIEFCLRFSPRTEIENFQNIERNRYTQMIGERVAKNICSVCLDRELDCVFECGHTFCTPCGWRLVLCPICNTELTNSRRLYIN